MGIAKTPYFKKLLCLICILPMLTLPADAAAFPTTSSDSKISNILLIGCDDPVAPGNSRADSILLCTYNPAQQTITMTSILRDLYVPIPGHKNNRINAAYAFGGMTLMEQTVEENFRVSLDGCVAVDFSRFPRLIDLLGGVMLELRADEADAINQRTQSNLTQGTHILNGDQALAYVRIRKLDKDGDFSRTSRQRKLIQALLDSYRNAPAARILKVLEETVSLVQTNMSRRQIFRTVLNMTPQMSGLQIIQQHIPAEGTYEYRTIRGMSVLVADLEKARELLSRSAIPGSN